MQKLFRHRADKVGLPPGTLIPVDKSSAEPATITLFDYHKEHFEEKEVDTIAEAFGYRDQPTVTWINVDGLYDVDLLQDLGEHFDIHPLVLEDILNTGQRPKTEDHGHYLFISCKMLRYGENDEMFVRETVSMILSEKFVISFQERRGDVLDSVRQRIRNAESRLRKSGTDYLTYRILDTLVDHYFLVLDRYGDRIEALELEVTEEPTQDTLAKIHQLKRELLQLRKPIWPMREALNTLLKSESKLLKKDTGLFLRDVHDHILQVTDTVDNFRELVSGFLDVYLSNISNKMNEVMKVLTIIATIFIPLTFLAGIYGMNFKFMPELDWRWGYFGIWAIMIIIGFGLVVYFRRKKWL